MSIIAYTCGLYTMDNLPENVFLVLLMLLPFFVGMAALTLHDEMLTKTQLVCILVAYIGICLLTNPEVFTYQNR